MILNASTNRKIEGKLAEWKKHKHFLYQRLTIMNVSYELGINRTYISNFINKHYGMNFNAWVNYLRLEEAKNRMKSMSSRNLSEIAVQVGFTDLAHFSKLFKRQEGVSPSVWRREKAESGL